MEEGESKAPVRVRLVFADRKLLSKAQRSEGFRRSWVVIRPDLTTVAAFCRDITSQFGPKSTSGHDLLLSMDGFRVPPTESTSIFKDNDEIIVEADLKKMKKMENKKAVASPTSVLQIKEKDVLIVPNNGLPLIDNGQEAIENKQKKRKRPSSEETSSKGEQKELKRPKCSKKSKMKPLDNARQATVNESKKVVPALATPSHWHIVNQKKNAPVLISERNQQVASISKNTSTGFSGGPDKKNVYGACLGVGTRQSRSRDWVPGQTRFMSPGAGPSNWKENGQRKSFQSDWTMTTRTYRKSRSGFNGPNAHNRNWEDWGDCSGPNAIDSQQLGNNFATVEPTEKVIPHGEKINGEIKDDKYFESFNPLPRLPMEGDIMAFRIDIIDDLGCPGFSSFRVGKVIVFDPVLMIIFLQPVPEYQTPDCEVSEYEKSMYKEDGSLEIGFESLVDLRLIKESKVKTTPKMSGKGKSKSKAPNQKDERNDNNVNSAWEAGNASNAEETTEHGWGAWAPSTGTAGASGQTMVQHGTGFGSQDGKFSNGWNKRNDNNVISAWEAGNASNAEETTEHGWGTWAPCTGTAGASGQTMVQHGTGFGSQDGKLSNGWNERNDNNVNSAWEAGNASNAEETTEHGWGAWEPSTGTAGASGQTMVQHGTGFGSQDGNFSNGWNGGGGNNNSTSAWEASSQDPNSNQGTQAQQNCWDAWEPSTSHAGSSWPRVGKHHNGFECSSGHSKRGRKGRGGKYFNPKFKK